MSKDGTAALSSSTVDDISQGIGSVGISNNDGISAAVAAASDMNSSREEDMSSEKKCTSCDQIFVNVKMNDVEVDNASGGVKSDKVLKEEVNSDVELSLCANCGKEGALNTCNKCKQVKYCNAACKKRHRHKHKKDCEEHLRRIAELQDEELRRAAELHNIKLFKQPPIPEEECPICFQRLPYLGTGKRYNSCCGKVICSGCTHAMDKSGGRNKLCPFCRVPTPASEVLYIEQIMKRVEVNDIKAIYALGGYHAQGMHGLPQDYTKAVELWHRAAELGHVEAYYNIGNVYSRGDGVEVDKKKAIKYYELGAIGGDAASRHNLAVTEWNIGNEERAFKHYMIAVESGHKGSLTNIQKLYSRGLATKDVYTEALRSYQKNLVEVKSIQRDKAAAASERYKYYQIYRLDGKSFSS